MYTICLVEDEMDLNSLIRTYLEKENYKVITYTKGNDAINCNNHVDLWILDIMLEDDVTGYDIIKHIREKDTTVPIIFSSARDSSIDKIMGLDMGGDDYLAKPYSPKELVLRVNNIIKRVYSSFSKEKYEDYDIDIERRIVLQNNKEITLTTLEFDLLIMFIDNKNKSFSREEVLKNIWGNDYFGSDRVVDDLIRRLRKKMPKLNINTIYG